MARLGDMRRAPLSLLRCSLMDRGCAMCVRPSPHSAKRAASAKAAPKSQADRFNTPDTVTTPLAFQASKLRRIYAFAYATAVTVASLAFGGVR